jgi:DMSO/TMAO reductase YedYZ molybdopterin-dependent catalytic subunit
MTTEREERDPHPDTPPVDPVTPTVDPEPPVGDPDPPVGDPEPVGEPPATPDSPDPAPFEEPQPEPAAIDLSSAAAPSSIAAFDERTAASRTITLHDDGPPPHAVPLRLLRQQSRRSFLMFAAGAAASAAGLWWTLPLGTKQRIAHGLGVHWLDTVDARSPGQARRARFFERVLTFDDDVAEALFSTSRRVRTYTRSDVTELRNNYAGRTPGPDYLPHWQLTIAGMSGPEARLHVADLARFPLHEQVTRLCCVEGWSAIAAWSGLRFADLLAAFPPPPSARWIALESAVNLDGAGRPDPYYVSIDLATARHPQSLLATHHNGQPLTLAHGAPLRLVVPMKLGLKNIKAITRIAYSATEPRDYWNERGYSKYDGL